MPLTFPAHQGLIAPVKLRWPNAIDGTALFIASGAPDFAYPIDPLWGHRSHSLFGIVVWAVPYTLLAAFIARRWAAAGIFAAAYDLGPLRLRSFRVLGTRRPPLLATVISAFIGAGGHAVVDAFTHNGRWGADLAGLNQPLPGAPVEGYSYAEALQDVGNLAGTLLFAALLLWLASRRVLERWYGVEQVAAARDVHVTFTERLAFAAIVAVPVLIVIPAAEWRLGSFVFIAVFTLSCSILLAGIWMGRRHPVRRVDQPPTPDERPSSQAPQPA
ncbi:MAG: DUF4184 family protein [Actinomycetota bacterium]